LRGSMLQVGYADFVSFLLAAISIGYAVYTRYTSSIAEYRSANEFQNIQDTLKRTKNEKESFAKSVNDICFQALLRAKNFPHNSEGFIVQRESMASTLQSLQRLAQTNYSGAILAGDFVHGSDLSALEASDAILDIVIITNDMQPDIDEVDLQSLIKSNVDAGRIYNYIIPQDLLDEKVDIFMKEISSESSVRLFKVDKSNYPNIFSIGAMALYRQKAPDAASTDIPTLIAFEEVVIPDERRGSLWRRMDPSRAAHVFELARAIIAGKR